MAAEVRGLTVTDGAVSKIKSVLAGEGFPSLLRVSVSGGGCAGFKYEFTTERVDSCMNVTLDDEDNESEEFDEDDEGDDEVSGGSDLILSDESGAPIILIDRYSKKFLRNSTIDYVEDMNGSRFVVNNPDAKFGCGCGNSFSL